MNENICDGGSRKANEIKYKSSGTEKRFSYDDETLAIELGKLKGKELCEMKMRQLMRENSHELRELERQLKAAYSFKSLASQLKEREASKMEERLQELKVQELLMNASYDAELREKRAEEEAKSNKERMRMSLQDQMIEKERKRQEMFIEELNERRKLNDVLEKIKQDDEKELEEQVLRQKKMKEEMEATFAAKNVWKSKQRMVIEEENKKLLEYQRLMETQVKNVNEEREKIRMKKDEEVERMCAELKKQREEVRVREELIQRLACVEQQEQQLRREREDEEREIQKKLENKIVLRQMADEKEKRLREEKELEKLLFEKMMEELERKNKLDQMGEEKRRLKKMVLRREALEVINKNREKYAEELLLVQHSNKLYAEEEKHKEELIKEERMKLLREHANKLIGFIKPGVLTETDYHELQLKHF